MASELTRFRERLRQTRAARVRTNLSPGVGNPTSASSDVGGLAPGSRVFDVVTGEEGEVIGGTRENVIVPTAGQSDR